MPEFFLAKREKGVFAESGLGIFEPQIDADVRRFDGAELVRFCFCSVKSAGIGVNRRFFSI